MHYSRATIKCSPDTITHQLLTTTIEFTEDGRLEVELEYTKRSVGEIEATTHQLLIQTPKDVNANVLTTQALLTHLDVLKRATSVKIDMFGTTWSLRDICSVPSTPEFDMLIYEQIFEGFVPCMSISPLDCFWEGSKLLGPEYSPIIP